LSINGGAFIELDPTTIFPNDEVGFCCDQIIQYVPTIDRFVWLLQGSSGTNSPAVSSGGYRLAVASPADIISTNGTAFNRAFWKLTPDFFGDCIPTFFDYPGLSVGSNHLYISFDVARCDSRNGRRVIRAPLAQLRDGGTVNIGYTDPSDSAVARAANVTQNTGDEVFWAGILHTSKLTVFSWAENSQTYFWRDIGISTFSTDKISSITPDGQDWLSYGFPHGWAIGAARSLNRYLWFAWTAGVDSNFKQPHIEMVQLDRFDNFEKLQQVQVWDDNIAFAYPALATLDCTGEIGLSLAYGGGGNYQNHAVGFWGDFLFYSTMNSDVGTSRYGDYFAIRQRAFFGPMFDAFGYGIRQNPPPGSGPSDVRYIGFGRPFCPV
jgi:hypothetical protein